MEITHEMRLKNFQLALSMVGISANLMTCELIHAISAKVDEKGGDFALKDATTLAETIQAKYQPPNPGNVRPMGQMMDKEMLDKMPPHIKEMMEKGQVQGSFKEDPSKPGEMIQEPPNELGR